MGHMGEPFRFDWELLKTRMGQAGESPTDPCLICIPKAGAKILVALMERLRWKATYRVGDYDYYDWDDLQNIVDETEEGMSVQCDSLVAQITQEITNNFTTIINEKSIADAANAGICCFLDSQPDVDPEPDEIIPTGDDRDEVCKSAQLAHDNGRAFLSRVFNYGKAGGGLSAGLIAFIIGLYAISLPAALLLTVVGVLVAIITDLATDEAEASWLAMKGDVVCAIYYATNPLEAKLEVDAVIDETNATGLSKQLFKALYSQAQINKIFNNQVGDASAYSVGYCEACGENNIIDVTFDFAESSEPFSLANTAYDEAEESIKFHVTSTTPTGGAANLNANLLSQFLELDADTSYELLGYEMQFQDISDGTKTFDHLLQVTPFVEGEPLEEFTQGGYQTLVTFSKILTSPLSSVSGANPVIGASWTRGTNQQGSGSLYSHLLYMRVIVRAHAPE